jgi:hypothetical protein
VNADHSRGSETRHLGPFQRIFRRCCSDPYEQKPGIAAGERPPYSCRFERLTYPKPPALPGELHASRRRRPCRYARCPQWTHDGDRVGSFGLRDCPGAADRGGDTCWRSSACLTSRCWGFRTSNFKKGTGTAFLAGLLLALVLKSLRHPAARRSPLVRRVHGSPAYGGTLLFLYGTGIAIPVVALGGCIAKLAARLERSGGRLYPDRATDALLVAMGLYLPWGCMRTPATIVQEVLETQKSCRIIATLPQFRVRQPQPAHAVAGRTAGDRPAAAHAAARAPSHAHRRAVAPGAALGARDLLCDDRPPPEGGGRDHDPPERPGARALFRSSRGIPRVASMPLREELCKAHECDLNLGSWEHSCKNLR